MTDTPSSLAPPPPADFFRPLTARESFENFRSNGCFARIHSCGRDYDPAKESALDELECLQASYQRGGLSPKESLEVRDRIQTLSKVVAPNAQQIRAELAQAERNYLARQHGAFVDGIMGPVLNKPGQLARALGAPENVVEMVHEGVFNVATAKIPGGAHEAVAEPVQMGRRGAARMEESQPWPEPAQPKAAEPAPVKEPTTFVARRTKQPSKERQQQQAHIFGTKDYKNRIKQGTQTSYFDNQADSDKYTKEAWEKGTVVPNADPNLTVKEYNFGFRVGSDYYKNGPQTWVRVIQDKDGLLHGYPTGPVVPGAPAPPGG